MVRYKSDCRCGNTLMKSAVDVIEFPCQPHDFAAECSAVATAAQFYDDGRCCLCIPMQQQQPYSKSSLLRQEKVQLNRNGALNSKLLLSTSSPTGSSSSTSSSFSSSWHSNNQQRTEGDSFLTEKTTSSYETRPHLFTSDIFLPPSAAVKTLDDCTYNNVQISSNFVSQEENDIDNRVKEQKNFYKHLDPHDDTAKYKCSYGQVTLQPEHGFLSIDINNNNDDYTIESGIRHNKDYSIDLIKTEKDACINNIYCNNNISNDSINDTTTTDFISNRKNNEVYNNMNHSRTTSPLSPPTIENCPSSFCPPTPLPSNNSIIEIPSLHFENNHSHKHYEDSLCPSNRPPNVSSNTCQVFSKNSILKTIHLSNNNNNDDERDESSRLNFLSLESTNNELKNQLSSPQFKKKQLRTGYTNKHEVSHGDITTSNHSIIINDTPPHSNNNTPKPSLFNLPLKPMTTITSVEINSSNNNNDHYNKKEFNFKCNIAAFCSYVVSPFSKYLHVPFTNQCTTTKYDNGLKWFNKRASSWNSSWFFRKTRDNNNNLPWHAKDSIHNNKKSSTHASSSSLNDMPSDEFCVNGFKYQRGIETKRWLFTSRLILAFLVISILFITNVIVRGNIYSVSNVPVIFDWFHTLTYPLNKWINHNATAYCVLVSLSSLLMDVVFILVWIQWVIFGDSFRMPIAYALLYIFRGLMRCICLFPFPQGYVWYTPSIGSVQIPSLTVPYQPSDDFFYSGHVACCMMAVLEHFYHRCWWGLTFSAFVGIFEFFVMVITRGHYSVDMIMGAIVAHWVHTIALSLTCHIDQWLLGLPPPQFTITTLCMKNIEGKQTYTPSSSIPPPPSFASLDDLQCDLFCKNSYNSVRTFSQDENLTRTVKYDTCQTTVASTPVDFENHSNTVLANNDFCDIELIQPKDSPRH